MNTNVESLSLTIEVYYTKIPPMFFGTKKTVNLLTIVRWMNATTISFASHLGSLKATIFGLFTYFTGFGSLWVWDMRTLRPYIIPIEDGAVKATHFQRISPLGILSSSQDHMTNGLMASKYLSQKSCTKAEMNLTTRQYPGIRSRLQEHRSPQVAHHPHRRQQR